MDHLGPKNIASQSQEEDISPQSCWKSSYKDAPDWLWPWNDDNKIVFFRFLKIVLAAMVLLGALNNRSNWNLSQ